MGAGGGGNVAAVDGAPLPVVPRLDGKPWGGRRLAEFGFDLPPDEPIGEALITASEAAVAAGPREGTTLGALAAADPAGLCGAQGLAVTGGRPVFPLLIKIIDAAANLSIQVHPDDAGAQERGPDQLGKTEAWVVLAASDGAIVYAGLAADGPLDTFAATVRAERGGTAAHLRQLHVRPGETLMLPAGTVHALGAGILVYEVQQPSDITYRLDDWGRLDAAGNPRQMHVEVGLAAVKPSLVPEPIDPVTLPAQAGARELLTACRYFATERISLPAAETMTFQADETPQVFTCLEGSGAIESGDGRMEIIAGGTVVVPAVAGIATFQATAPAVLLRSWVPNLLVDVIVPARAGGASDDAIARLGGPLGDIREVLGGSA